VAVIDIKKNSKTGAYEVWTHNSSRNTQRDPVEFAQQLESLGVGEITLNSIDQDGVMKGYDLEIAQRVRNAVTVPMTVLGGAGKMSDIAELIRRLGVVGAAAGSLFVFKGIYRAVLISYPNYDQKSIAYSAARVDQEA
jgi:cyclase